MHTTVNLTQRRPWKLGSILPVDEPVVAGRNFEGNFLRNHCRPGLLWTNLNLWGPWDVDHRSMFRKPRYLLLVSTSSRIRGSPRRWTLPRRYFTRENRRLMELRLRELSSVILEFSKHVTLPRTAYFYGVSEILLENSTFEFYSIHGSKFNCGYFQFLNRRVRFRNCTTANCRN